eukprot:CAMPEP_0119336252 /NCGR_PEP_ID=MMETSP1333-20130426/91422_1 /TAXON_ID=418940 /ORGANISM="Scyphosphaera apsteinii, Strain RCC1455" /LENGTH=135 /DNA_ID=CAMNT_0007347011 /DNA_START=379 /DNA_END=786 /DNA_ORIENTATION=-
MAMGMLFIWCQVLGSMLGVELARYYFNVSHPEQYGPATPLFVDSGLGCALVYEAVCSFLMVLVQLGICESIDKNFVVASTLVVLLTRYTGAAMDPLGPTCAGIFARDSSHIEIGWFGGLFGGAIAGLFWRVGLKK